jgi:hypothetical protein
MDSFTLNASQRAALQAAIARRAKAARLEHYRRQAELAATPDYFQHMEHARRFTMDLRAWCRDRRMARAVHLLRGCDPYNVWRGLAA